MSNNNGSSADIDSHISKKYEIRRRLGKVSIPQIPKYHHRSQKNHQISPKISIDGAKTEAPNSTRHAHNKTDQPHLDDHRAPMAWSGKPRTGNLPQLWLWRRSLMPFATELTLSARSGNFSCFWPVLQKIIISGKLSFWKSLGATRTSSSCWTCTGLPTTRTSTSSSSSWRPTSTTWSRRATSSRASTDNTSCTSCSRWIFSQIFVFKLDLFLILVMPRQLSSYTPAMWFTATRNLQISSSTHK